MNRPDYQSMADYVCEIIQEEREATDKFVEEVLSFLRELPDLKGDLKVQRMLLANKCIEYLQEANNDSY